MRPAHPAAWLWLGLVPLAGLALGHDLSADNASFVEGLSGAAPGPFIYLGAKHMVTGYDHLLFLLGVVFFLQRAKDVVLYVTLFTLGHSSTLLLGVLMGWEVNAYLIDAFIGLSVVYKGFENLRGFDKLPVGAPDTRLAVLAFGLCHGLGLATKIQGYAQPGDGLFTNMLSFNFGVELGQLLALAFMLILLQLWRRRPGFKSQADVVNVCLMVAGFVFFGIQITGYVLS